MLQCGLGAFSAAMLHILAHSLYKAHAFLNSGNVIAESTGLKPVSNTAQTTSAKPSPAGFLALAFGFIAVFLTVLTLVGLSPATKPGGYVLSAILAGAILSMLWTAYTSQQERLLQRTLLAVVGLCAIYIVSFIVVDRILSPNIISKPNTWLEPIMVLVVIGIFSVLFVLDRWTPTWRNNRWKNKLYIHASNGFYVEALMRRIGQILTT